LGTNLVPEPIDQQSGPPREGTARGRPELRCDRPGGSTVHGWRLELEDPGGNRRKQHVHGRAGSNPLGAIEGARSRRPRPLRSLHFSWSVYISRSRGRQPLRFASRCSQPPACASPSGSGWSWRRRCRVVKAPLYGRPSHDQYALGYFVIRLPRAW